MPLDGSNTHQMVMYSTLQYLGCGQVVNWDVDSRLAVLG